VTSKYEVVIDDGILPPNRYNSTIVAAAVKQTNTKMKEMRSK
jgi:hypothetical protein